LSAFILRTDRAFRRENTYIAAQKSIACGVAAKVEGGDAAMLGIDSRQKLSESVKLRLARYGAINRNACVILAA
jgi:hypothetical protein